MAVSLENLPVELKKVVIRKLRWCLKEVQGGIEGCSVKCPYDENHFVLYRYSTFNSIELLHCHQCGYRYVLVKQDGRLLLVNQPEKKQLIIRRGR